MEVNWVKLNKFLSDIRVHNEEYPMSKYLNIVNPSVACEDFPPAEELACPFPFPLDPFQKHAVKAIHQGQNVLVTAKTGSGKTLVGEYLIHHCLNRSWLSPRHFHPCGWL